jgi:hypothetical protein
MVHRAHAAASSSLQWCRRSFVSLMPLWGSTPHVHDGYVAVFGWAARRTALLRLTANT